MLEFDPALFSYKFLTYLQSGEFQKFMTTLQYLNVSFRMIFGGTEVN